jgi:hypothetical protein
MALGNPADPDVPQLLKVLDPDGIPTGTAISATGP